MKFKSVLIIMSLLILIPLISASTYSDCETYGICAEATGDITSAINYSTVSVNNSGLFDGYDSTYFMPLNTSVIGDFDFDGNIITTNLYSSVTEGSLYVGDGHEGEIGGQYETMVGSRAGDLSSGLRLQTFGRLAGYDSSGDYVTAVGYSTARGNTGDYLTAIGTNAGYDNVGDQSVFIGSSSGQLNTGHYSMGIGHNTLYNNSGVGSVAIGRYSGFQNTGIYLTANGFDSGRSNTGNYVLALGGYAGSGNTGDNCVFLGHKAGQNNVLDNQFILKNGNFPVLIQGDFSYGYVGINTSTPQNTLNVVGDLNVTGQIDGQEIIVPIVGVFAYTLPESGAVTTVTTAGVYVPINNTFNNTKLDQFYFNNSIPAIVYNNSRTEYFEIDWQATVKGDSNGITSKVGIKRNDILELSSIMGTFMKVAGESQSMSGTTVIELTPGDSIQLVVTSDGDDDNLEFDYFTTSIRRFY